MLNYDVKVRSFSLPRCSKRVLCWCAHLLRMTCVVDFVGVGTSNYDDRSYEERRCRLARYGARALHSVLAITESGEKIISMRLF